MQKKESPKILIVDDNEDLLIAAKLFLRNNGFTVITERSPDLLIGTIKREKVSVVMLDMNFRNHLNTGNEGLNWLRQIKSRFPDVVVIMITAYGDVDLAVKSLKEGAADFILKPWDNDRLLDVADAACNAIEKINNATQTPKVEKPVVISEIIGHSQVTKNIISQIEKVAKTDASILIQGENGCGKELIAQVIHQTSVRNKKTFIPVDLSSLNEQQAEHELFGFARGNAPDAKDDKAGAFEAAGGGTLFIKEIANLSLSLQSKLFKTINEGIVQKPGSGRSIQVDVRLICSTQANLMQMVNEKSFRQDLLYKLNTVEINVTPLRERVEDVKSLAKYFVEFYCRKYNKPYKTISATALKDLEKYKWPGNVTELQHNIERAVIMSERDELVTKDFFASEFYSVDTAAETANLEEIEKNVIRKTLSKHSGNITQAAKELGLTRASLYRRIEKYGF